jgi:hypothetical protein
VANFEFVPGDHPDRVNDLNQDRGVDGRIEQLRGHFWTPRARVKADRRVRVWPARGFCRAGATASGVCGERARSADPRIFGEIMRSWKSNMPPGMLFCFAYPRRVLLVYVIVLGSAVVLEFSQLLTPDRHARICDAIQKLGGGTAGVLSGQAIVYFKQARGWFRN